MRRTTFRLAKFLQDLEWCFVEERPDLIDDTVQRYKDFLSHTNRGMFLQVKTYMDKHPLVTNNQTIKSYVEACHRQYFEV